MDNTQINLPTRKPVRTSTDHLKSTVILFVLVIFMAIGVPGLVSRFGTVAGGTWHCITNDCNPKGPAASWQDQFSAADTAIAAISIDYALESINFRPAAYKYDRHASVWTPDDAFEVHFTYVISNGFTYDVTMVDTRPSAVTTLRDLNTMVSQAAYAKAVEANLNPSQFKISPRQAAEIAWNQFRTQEGAFDLGITTGLGDETGWIVGIEPPYARGGVISPYFGTGYFVDAITGQTTVHDPYQRATATPTIPTPTP